MGKLVTPMKIDISTGDVITPRAIEYKYKLLLDNRSINLWSYNLETILAEKLQTVLARGLLNTRMRDFYDIKTLLSIYEQDIDADVLKKAFEATCKKRSTENLKEEAPKIMAAVSDDAQLHTLWKSYQKKYPYAADISYEDIMKAQCSYGVKFNNRWQPRWRNLTGYFYTHFLACLPCADGLFLCLRGGGYANSIQNPGHHR